MASRLVSAQKIQVVEIDLNAGHNQAPRDALPPCACGAAGRGRCVAASPVRSQGTGGRGGQHRSPRVGQRAGHRREDRGRVPADLVARFKAATPEVNQGDGPVAGLWRLTHMVDMPVIVRPRIEHNAAARVQLAWILGLSERRVLEPVGEQLLLAENVDGGVGGRQPAGQDEQLPCCGTADGDVGFAVAAGDRDAGWCPRDQPLTGTG